MTDSNSHEDLEKERIAAWRAERLRVADADKAQRIAQQQVDREAHEKQSELARDDAAMSMIRETETRAHPNALPSQKRKQRGILRSTAILVVPAVVTAFYLFAVATPLYEAQSVIAISKSNSTASNNGDGLLGRVQRSAGLSDVFLAYSFIKSQAMMDALEDETGFVSELSSRAIDPVQRLRDIGVISYSKLMQFDRFVEASVDIQSGLLTLYVRAPSKEQAIEISGAVLDQTELQINTLGNQVFDRRQSNALDTLIDAQDRLTQAQADLVALQISYQEADPRNRIESIYDVIRDLEAEAQDLNSSIQRAEIAGVENSAQALQAIELEQRVRAKIQEERARLVAPIGSNQASLNTLLIEFELATLNVAIAQDAVKSALTAQSEANQDAALNRSLFQVVVPPRTAQTAIFPKIPGTIALVFLMSLTLLATLSLFRPKRPF